MPWPITVNALWAKEVTKVTDFNWKVNIMLVKGEILCKDNLQGICLKYTNKIVKKLGVGRASFSALGSGFGFFDLARVGFWIFGYFLGSSTGLRNIGLGQDFLHFSVNFGWIQQKITNISQKTSLRVTRVLQNLPRVSSGS